MLQASPQMRMLVCVEPVDFRNGIDCLAKICRATLAENPFRVTVFGFRKRRGTTIKVLAYDGQGFWLWQKTDFHRSIQLAAGGRCRSFARRTRIPCATAIHRRPARR